MQNKAHKTGCHTQPAQIADHLTQKIPFCCLSFHHEASPQLSFHACMCLYMWFYFGCLVKSHGAFLNQLFYFVCQQTHLRGQKEAVGLRKWHNDGDYSAHTSSESSAAPRVTVDSTVQSVHTQLSLNAPVYMLAGTKPMHMLSSEKGMSKGV